MSVFIHARFYRLSIIQSRSQGLSSYRLRAVLICDVTLYADDTVLFISDKSLHNIKSCINSDLERLNNWLKLNHLALSISKSKFMIIGSSQRLNKIDSISFKVDNMDLDEVSSFEYLGIVINNRLT